jgi:hypothetical protein
VKTKSKKAKIVIQKYKEVESLISSVSNITDGERKELAKSNVWALISNIEIV